MPHSLRVRLKNLQRKGELTEKDIDRIFKALEQEPCDDVVSRQAVLDNLSELNVIGFYEAQQDSKETYYEIRKMVESLPPVRPQEPIPDQWQELKETITEMRDNDGTATQQEACKFLVNYMEVLEKQMQEPKTGHWIKSRDSYGNHHFICSECGNDIATRYADNWEDKYCSECGAKMVEPQESEEQIYKEYEAEVITRGNCMMCGKELTEGLFLCKECEAKFIHRRK